MYEDFLETGFKKFHEPYGLDFIKIDNYRLMNVEERSRDNGEKDLPQDLVQKLNTFAHFLCTKYILPKWEDAKYNKFIVWDGVDRDNQGWHTDMFEGYDVFMLYYFDDTDPSTGGSVSFKWNKDKQAQFYPKAGDLFLVSNTRGFWHKAESTTIRRRVASFDFNTRTNE